jgi:hypothetical protein
MPVKDIVSEEIIILTLPETLSGKVSLDGKVKRGISVG